MQCSLMECMFYRGKEKHRFFWTTSHESSWNHKNNEGSKRSDARKVTLSRHEDELKT